MILVVLKIFQKLKTRLKAIVFRRLKYVKAHYRYDCFADDTGLEVAILNGAPGVYSARYAGEQRNADDNMDKLLTELRNETNRNAQFKTVITLQLNNKQYTFTGICEGEITNRLKVEGLVLVTILFLCPKDSNKPLPKWI